MKYWPIKNSISNSIPKTGTFGGFWEERDEGFNAGVDIYANDDKDVLAIESGVIIDIDKFSIENQEGLLDSHFVVIKSLDKMNYKYCEIIPYELKIGQKIEAGQKIGVLSKLYNENILNHNTPIHIRENISQGLLYKLHLELYKAPFSEVRPYKLGNYLGEDKPKSLLNPFVFLSSLKSNFSNSPINL
ncbi:M23 family metallopeptidase [Candidatus Kapabacteria bacterium]|nr:M23 family metallopeptidase [Candidatus Kapabacteria bacterium]